MRKRTGLLGVQAECETCGWGSTARNAAGTGAQHAARYGHHVRVESTTIAIHNHPDDER
jgi:hypothetical protein